MDSSISVFDLFGILLGHCNVDTKVKDLLDALDILSGLPLGDSGRAALMMASAMAFDMDKSQETVEKLLNATAGEFVDHIKDSVALKNVAAAAKEL
jgi:hypothetical protein